MKLSHFYQIGVVGASVICALAFALPAPVKVTLTSASNIKATGKVTFTQVDENKIQVEGKLSGLSAGKHGMHVHAMGDCSDTTAGFKKSGGHFNPHQGHHSSLADKKSHAGDLGNVVVDAHGNADFKIVTDKFSLVGSSDKNIVGKALVVHAGEDDEKTDPAGNSGERVLCGVIK